MKSNLISIFLCVCVLITSLFMIFNFPKTLRSPSSDESHAETEEKETKFVYDDTSREFIIKTAHDAEDYVLALAYGTKTDYREGIDDLISRLEHSAKTLKDEYGDFVGANWFSKVAALFESVTDSPFTSTEDFSTKVSRMLYELKNSYPSSEAALQDENDPGAPMYYPSFDTGINGTTTLAMLSIFRQQYQEKNDCILLTFGGNTVFGDTLLGAEEPDSFRNQVANSTQIYPFYKLASVLKTDTLSFTNLETPFTESITGSNTPGSLKGLPSYAKLLKDNGIDVVSLSAPGVNDYGQNGKIDTISALNDANVAFSDESVICYQETSLGSVAYITYNIIDEVSESKNLPSKSALTQDIDGARQSGAKFVVVHFNWITTEKNQREACSNQTETARAAVECGADLVFGSHPSGVQGFEQYLGSSIIFSTGNLFELGETCDTPYLFQQAFSLDEDGNAVAGEIMMIPLSGTDGDDGNTPSFVFDQQSTDALKTAIKDASKGTKYGAGRNKKDCISLEELGIITISDQ